MRGEYAEQPAHDGIPLGSSPHAWGILAKKLLHEKLLRFIPTCVGNTSCSTSWSGTRAVHPHMRGEYARLDDDDISCRGSSPRAWGIRSAFPALWGQRRFIPTCVGNTSSTGAYGVRPPVHPHVRGEYDSRLVPIRDDVGSSPRAWGIPFSRDSERTCCRFIPTCVGNT